MCRILSNITCSQSLNLFERLGSTLKRLSILNCSNCVNDLDSSRRRQRQFQSKYLHSGKAHRHTSKYIPGTSQTSTHLTGKTAQSPSTNPSHPSIITGLAAPVRSRNTQSKQRPSYFFIRSSQTRAHRAAIPRSSSASALVST